MLASTGLCLHFPSDMLNVWGEPPPATVLSRRGRKHKHPPLLAVRQDTMSTDIHMRNHPLDKALFSHVDSYRRFKFCVP